MDYLGEFLLKLFLLFRLYAQLLSVAAPPVDLGGRTWWQRDCITGIHFSVHASIRRRLPLPSAVGHAIAPRMKPLALSSRRRASSTGTFASSITSAVFTWPPACSSTAAASS